MKFSRRLDDAADELRSVARLVQLVVLLGEALDRLFLAAEELHDGVPAMHLLDVAVERPGRCPLGDELLLRTARDHDRHRDGQRDGQQRDHGEDRADREHHDQDADDGQQRRDELGQALLERLPDVVDVVGHPAQQVAAGVRVEIAQRQAGELLVDIAAQAVHRPLGDTGHDPGLSPREDRAEDVHAREQPEDPREGSEVNALTGRHGHAREHVGELRLSAGPQPGDRLLLGHPGRDLLADDAIEDDVGRVAEDLRAEDREEDADHGETDHENDERRLGAQPAEQASERRSEVLRLLAGAHGHAHHPGASSRAGAACTRSADPGRRASRRAARRSAASGTSRSRPAHATASSADSCEYTISR